MLLVALVGLISAQAAGLDYGQWSQEPWTAKYVFQSGYDAPDANWAARDFDDSAWGDIQGPISNDSEYYYNTAWEDTYSTYWLRRHFTVENLNNHYWFLAIHDDQCFAYLNGHLIYSGEYVTGYPGMVELDAEALGYLVKGDNVLAIQAVDNGGGQAFIDCGLYESSEASGLVSSSPYTIEFSQDGDFPWLDTDNGVKVSDGMAYGTSVLRGKVSLPQPTVVSFDYTQKGYSDSWYSYLDFKVDGATMASVSGESNEGTVNVVVPAGDWELQWEFYTRYQDQGYEATVSNLVLHSQYATITTDTNGQVGKQTIYQFDRLDNPELIYLKIVGPVGTAEQDDWNDLRNMTYLSGLDLSEAVFDAVPDQALQGMSHLSYLLLPDNVTSIGDYAFESTKLLSLDVPAPVETIGDYAFRYSTICGINFKSDNHLTQIGYAAFSQCKSLKEFYMPNSVSSLKRYENYSNYDCSTFSECAGLEKIRFSNSLTVIPSSVCRECTSLKEVQLPENLEKLEENCFYFSPIESVNFPTSLREIGANSFALNHLTEVVLPERLTTLGVYAFQNSDYLTYVELPSYIPYYNDNFYGCPLLETVVCKSPTPPVVETDPFRVGATKSNVTLLVPSFALTDYKLDNYWQEFGNIQPIDIDLDYWRISGTLGLTNDLRWGEKPDVDLYYGGKLTVSGSNPLNMKTFVYYAGESNPGSMVNRTENINTDSINTVFPITADYWYFFAPLYDVNVEDIQHSDASASIAIRYYDGATRAANGSGGWKNVTDAQLHPGIGYIIQSNKTGDIYLPTTASTRSAMFQTEAAATVLEEHASESNAHKSWNLVGNPFPCYYDIYYLDFTAPITVWNTSSRTYTAYSITDDDYALRPMQAFFVQKPDELENIVFPITGRQNTSTIASKVSAPAKDAQAQSRFLFNVEITGAAGSDATRVVLNEERSLSYELQCDASKFMSLDPTVPQIYTYDADGTRMAINERLRLDGRIALGVTLGAAGDYTFSASRIDGELTLLDTKTNSVTDLSTDSYTFSVDGAETISDRFYLCASADASGIISAVEGKTAIKAVAEGISIIAPAGERAMITNVAGITYYNAELQDSETTVSLQRGVYIVRVGQTTTKVIVK
ncbi:MAG: leucine-rich repeat domain-containing protein [Bacteroidales bacterium]|nr:leucine-rich repeat domain-containing protein [Bacteroidales bacterium]